MKLYAEQVAQLLATEKNLRLQLTADGEKFLQFQVTVIYPQFLSYLQHTISFQKVLFTVLYFGRTVNGDSETNFDVRCFCLKY